MRIFYFYTAMLLCSTTPAMTGQGDFFPYRDGITGAAPLDIVNAPRSHIEGAPSNSFNLYIDNYALAYYRFRADCDRGADGRFQNCINVDTNFLDERDFSSARKDNINDKRYWHSVPQALEEGDNVLIQIFVNNAGLEKKFTALQSYVTVDWSNPEKVVSRILSENSQPKMIGDIVTFSISNDMAFIHNHKKYGNGKVRIKFGNNNDVKYRYLSETSIMIPVGSIISSYSESRMIYVPLTVIRKN